MEEDSKPIEYNDNGWAYFGYVELLQRFGEVYTELGQNMTYIEMQQLLHIYETNILGWPTKWQWEFWTVGFMYHPMQMSPAKKREILKQADCDKEKRLLEQRANMPLGILRTDTYIYDGEVGEIPAWRQPYYKEVWERMLAVYGPESDEWSKLPEFYFTLPLSLWPEKLIKSYTWYADSKGRPIVPNDGETRRLMKIYCEL